MTQKDCNFDDDEALFGYQVAKLQKYPLFRAIYVKVNGI